jgi:acetylglutamate kinase
VIPSRTRQRNARPSTPSRTAPVVIKLGGRALERPGSLRELAAALARRGGSAVLVHGGGAEVSEWCSRLGLATRFVNGLRVTDPETLEVATAVLAGLANKRLVAELRDAGLDAVGLSALDGGIVEVMPHRDTAALGAVGEVRAVHPNLVEVLLAGGRVPVIASLAADRGRLLNVNADDLAAALARALGARMLALFSDVSGVRVASEVKASMNLAEIDAALAGGDITGGMEPKLRAARAAVEDGVARAWIGEWHGPDTLDALLARASVGTFVLARAEHSAEPLERADVAPTPLASHRSTERGSRHD